jgi:hypothetical protein
MSKFSFPFFGFAANTVSTLKNCPSCGFALDIPQEEKYKTDPSTAATTQDDPVESGKALAQDLLRIAQNQQQTPATNKQQTPKPELANQDVVNLLVAAIKTQRK